MLDRASIIVLVVSMVSLSTFVFAAWFSSLVNRRTLELARRVTRPDAVLSELCMVRFGFRECPGFIQVTRDTLFVDTAFFNIHLALPLSGINLEKFVGGGWRYTGSRGWIGRYRLHLTGAAAARPVVLGVKDGAAWRRALQLNP
jgi:hypothetical protein